MAVISDVSIDWISSPRIITIGSSITELDIQDLYDTLATHQAYIWNMVYKILCVAEGKVDLGGGVFSGIVISLNNAKIKFADRAGPGYTECKIVEGTIKAFEDVDVTPRVPIPVIEPSDYTFATVDNEIGGTIATSTSTKGTIE